jgi:hypothetical protein
MIRRRLGSFSFAGWQAIDPTQTICGLASRPRLWSGIEVGNTASAYGAMMPKPAPPGK